MICSNSVHLNFDWCCCLAPVITHGPVQRTLPYYSSDLFPHNTLDYTLVFPVVFLNCTFIALITIVYCREKCFPCIFFNHPRNLKDYCVSRHVPNCKLLMITNFIWVQKIIDSHKYHICMSELINHEIFMFRCHTTSWMQIIILSQLVKTIEYRTFHLPPRSFL